MQKEEVVMALERGFDYDREKFVTALMKLGILHWAKGRLRW